jgi:hypothetical protein
MRKFLLLTTVLGGLLLTSCQRKQHFSPLEFQPNLSFELAYSDTGHCSCGGLDITFADVVEEIYRPAWREGVEEGQVRVRFDVQADSVSESIELVFRSTRSSFDRDTVSGYVIRLMGITPYPRAGRTADKQAYRAKLMVEELP